MNRTAVFLTLFVIVCCTACSPETARISAVTPISDEAAAVPTASATMVVNAVTVPAGATATPLEINLEAGRAMSIAAATDTAMRPTPRNPITFDDTAPIPIRFDEFYDGYDLRRGLLLSDKLVSLDGLTVVMEGYMAPPLKPELDYFVLTRVRLAFCPFCSTAADWPDDIALVYLSGDAVTATTNPVRITGRMEIGQSVDPETGMVSLVRIYSDDLEILG